jgi:hypothetical protein
MLHSIKRLYMKHRGESVWIVGSDPSLSNYPDNFLDNKNGITLHLAHLKFPNVTYRYSSEYDRSEYLGTLDGRGEEGIKRFHSLRRIPCMDTAGTLPTNCLTPGKRFICTNTRRILPMECGTG